MKSSFVFSILLNVKCFLVILRIRENMNANNCPGKTEKLPPLESRFCVTLTSPVKKGATENSEKKLCFNKLKQSLETNAQKERKTEVTKRKLLFGH